MTDELDPPDSEDEIPVVAKNIQRFRQARGMTQLQLATTCNVAERTIRRYETGESEPPGSTLREIAKALRIPKARFYIEREGKLEVTTTAPKPAPSTSSALRQLQELYARASAPVRAAILRVVRRISGTPKE